MADERVEKIENVPEAQAYLVLAQRVYALELHREHETALLQEIRSGQSQLIGKIEEVVHGLTQTAGDQKEFIHRATQLENRLSAIEESRSKYIHDFVVLETVVESGFKSVSVEFEKVFKKIVDDGIAEKDRRKELDSAINANFNRWGWALGILITLFGMFIKYAK